ncbi:aromatic acid exporter family protein [Mycobacterium sp. E740]|uniref:FUSC family protein n=1 Tax=Mycobacterium sp. E740 TaxID=1834149 RepID=UPI0007FD8128|nr:hypothetical protein [Mycobacterium sp. E740]OBI74341.1 hypothetical protein A5663_05775 [Mycobacterium sp. E740]
MSSLVKRAERGVGRLRFDRDSALALAKAAISSTTAWVLATQVFGGAHASFAAFAALLLVGMTIADSVGMAMRYTAAMLVGIGLVGGAVWWWGVHLWLFPLILVIALAIGRWHRLGGQGVNVAVAAIFAYGVFALPSVGPTHRSPLPSIAGMVVLGAVVALAVTLIVAPPLRYRSARHAVASLSGSLTDLLSDMTETLARRFPDGHAVRGWRRRAEALPDKASQARQTVDHALHTSKLNPRRLFVHDHSDVGGDRLAIQALERIAQQLRSVAAGLERAVERDDRGQEHEAFLHRYGALLAAVRDAVVTLGDGSGADGNGSPLADEARRCQTSLDELADFTRGHVLDQPTQWAVYRGLHTDAERLCEEVHSASDAYCDASVRSVDR